MNADHHTTLSAVSMTGFSLLDDTTANVTSPSPGNSNTTHSLTVPEGCLVFPFSTFAPWNNPEDLISRTNQQYFENFLDVYLMTLFFLISVPSNIINIIVFWKHGIKERINLCLFFLSFADFIVVFSHFEWKLDRLYSVITNTPYQMVILKYNIDHMIHSLAGFIYVSGFMSTLIAFERCLCVVSPLKAQRIIQTKTTAAIIFVGHGLIFGGHYIIATRWKVVCMFDPAIRQTTDGIYSSEFYLNNQDFIDVFEGVIFGILLPGCYVAGVSVSTAVIIAKVRTMAQWRDQSTSASASGGSAAKDLTLTRMLIGTNVVFVMCTAPPLIFHFALPFLPELSLTGKYYNAYSLLINLQQLLAFLNSSCNFFVYYFFGTKFRTTVQGMFCRSCKMKNEKKSGVEPCTQTSMTSTK